MAKKSLLEEGKAIDLAVRLITLGARLQLLESETGLSKERLTALYKEIKGMSPPKGMLPFSTDWFLTWQPCIHASMFYGAYKYLRDNTTTEGVEQLIKAYKLYLEHLSDEDKVVPPLSLMRAWTLTRFMDRKMLTTKACKSCGGVYIVDPMNVNRHYICGICQPPARAGKTKK